MLYRDDLVLSVSAAKYEVVQRDVIQTCVKLDKVSACRYVHQSSPIQVPIINVMKLILCGAVFTSLVICHALFPFTVRPRSADHMGTRRRYRRQTCVNLPWKAKIGWHIKTLVSENLQL